MSYLLSGGSASDLFKITKTVKAFVAKMVACIRSTSVDLNHKFIPVQLVYNKMTLNKEFLGLNTHKEGGNTPILGQSFPKFLDYNSLVLDDVKKPYPDAHAELSDPNELLAVKTCTDTRRCSARYSTRSGTR